MKRASFVVVSTGFALLFASTASAAILNGLAADRGIRTDATATNTPTQGGYQVDDGSDRLVGGSSGQASAGNVSSRSVVFVFQLPTLGAGESFTSADLNFTRLASATGDQAPFSFNADLYGLGRRASSAVSTADGFAGGFDATDATLIQNNILGASAVTTPATTFTEAGISTEDSAGANSNTSLIAYLNTQYAGGTGAGQFVFLRVNPDVSNVSNDGSRWRLATADDATATRKPTLNYTAEVVGVPEPATLGIFAMAWLLAAGRRTRRRGTSV